MPALARHFAVVLLLVFAAHAQIVEIGVAIGDVFYDDGIDGGQGKSEIFRASIFGGYQFNSQSDQITLAIITDKKVDEAQLGYSFVMPSLRNYTPFDGFPYIKAAIGLGGTYAKNLTPTHLSYSLGAGFYAPIKNSGFRARFEAGFLKREWQIDRRGEEREITATTWSDTEINFNIGIGYVW
ncbi:hypothetical protein FACS189487_07130 [Campylobacterota bacterium]|nr:hypothetical protein FACS189487_07130 [Campylobacterota bacterium]